MKRITYIVLFTLLWNASLRAVEISVQDGLSGQFETALKSCNTDQDVRTQASALAATFDTTEGISVLSSKLTTGRGGRRKELAALTLAIIGSDAARTALVDAATGSGGMVAENSLSALAEHWSTSAEDSVQNIAAAAAADTRTRTDTVRLLGATGGSGSKTFLESMLQNELPESLKQAVEEAIEQIESRLAALSGDDLAAREKEGRAFYRGELRIRNDRSPSSAARGIAGLLIALDESFSVEFLGDKLEEAATKRSMAASALAACLIGELKLSGGLDVLKEFAGTGKMAAASQVFWAIENYTSPEAISLLEEILQDATRRVKHHAAGSLHRIATSVSSAELLESLAEEDSEEFVVDPELKEIYLECAKAIRDRLAGQNP